MRDTAGSFFLLAADPARRRGGVLEDASLSKEQTNIGAAFANLRSMLQQFYGLESLADKNDDPAISLNLLELSQWHFEHECRSFITAADLGELP